MDDDAMQQALDIGDFEIERRLDAFARARLTPDPAAVARTRARVMREARLQLEAARNATHVVPAVTVATHPRLARRIAMPLLAASLWVGVAVGSVAASQAGGPLYPTRVWVERATLPVAAAERTSAELGRLDARLGDAFSAATRGDAGGVAAALAAYRQIADETVAGSSGDESLETLVGAALNRHVAVLTAVSQRLQEKGGTTAASAVETAILRAIEHNEAVVANLAGDDHRDATDGAGGPAGGVTSGGATSGGSAGGATSGGPGGGVTSGAPSGATSAGGSTGGGPAGPGTGTTGGSGQTDNGQTGSGGGAESDATGGSGQAGNGQEAGSKPSRPPRASTAPDDQQGENDSDADSSRHPSE